MNPNIRSSNDRATLAAIARRAMIERGLEPDFPPAAKQELAAIGGPATASGEVRDLRDRLWASIDNDDSRDLDQLTVAEPLAGGQVRILVAVADVDALVRKGSALDGHASRNTTSVYTPAAIFPMLPEALSTDLSSLNEDQDRIAVVADMVFETDGSLATSDLYRAHVRNHGKLAYRSVAAWLDSEGAAPRRVAEIPGLDENLRLQDSLAQRLVAVRHRHGALSLETIQTKAVFDGDVLSDLDTDRRNRAKQLIEDFMINANGVTATYLASKKFPSLRRVLRSPERWDRIAQLASGLGEQLPKEPDAVALEAFLERRRKADPEKFPDLSLAVVKLIGRGEYALDLPGGVAPGHFGLAVKDYTHSTAPNRRFPDLITQRLLKAAMSGAPLPYTIPELTELAKHCTEQEDAATKVERRVRKSAEALLLSGRITEHFDAIVTGASPKGTWVRIFQPPVEGKLERGFQGLDVGDHVHVKLVHTDVERGFIDFVRD
ncbi:MAG: RNB domain-containing ribonuclease [Chthoniobacter sp.]|uniref:RNB domain-containing ribonuclease n=1 Tax=Chthoniobacter sp. TaxID=2510640 RepID=UPI0032A3668B